MKQNNVTECQNSSEKSNQPSIPVDSVLRLVQPDGLLSRNISGFEVRHEQRQMMSNIIEAYNGRHIALIEAGTGTGKTLAYLLPAVIWALQHKERTLISTNTITLQEQILTKDIPLLSKALNVSIKAVLVKGMGNYACIRKVRDIESELNLMPERESEEIKKITAWCHTSHEGSRSSLSFTPLPTTWERVNAESDTCTGNQCPHYNECFFFKARREAADAQILISNHHLLFSDIACRAETNNYETSAILPSYNRLILDEAHNIEDIATDYFAARISRFGMINLLGKFVSESRGKAHGKIPVIKKILLKAYSNQIPSNLTSIYQRLELDLPNEKRNLSKAVNDLFQIYAVFISLVGHKSSIENEGGLDETKLRLKQHHCDHPYWLQEVVPHTKALIIETMRYVQSVRSICSDLQESKDDALFDRLKTHLHELNAFSDRLEHLCDILQTFSVKEMNSIKVRWIELQKSRGVSQQNPELMTTNNHSQLNKGHHNGNVHLINAELDIAGALAASLFTKFATVVLCSATLTTNKEFRFIRNRLGITPALLQTRRVTENIYDSPFDYQKQTLLAVPSDIPHPSHPHFLKIAAENIWLALQASHGNAFILFTSYQMLQQCHRLLIDRLLERRFNVLKQGDDNRLSLINRFKCTNRSVLFGTDSFWEGVDIVGEALRCVIIVKLPFKVPSEPIVEARTEAIINGGGDAFMDYTVPHAIVKFKQGFGRLIRNRRDRGCIVCLDNRLITKGYGTTFINSLPACQQAFVESSRMHENMSDFYRRTYYLVAGNHSI